MRRKWIFALVLISCTSQAHSQGLIGGLVDKVVPGAGKKLDEAHDAVKKANPIYGKAEETISGGVRQVTAETFVETTWPLLVAAINASRGDALSQGVQNIPADIQEALSIYFPTSLLQHVKYRVAGGGDLSLQVNSFRYGDAVAITLNDVIVFQSYAGASDLRLWAHELGHAQQYRDWGLHDFAKRYIRDYQGVENQANGVADAFTNAYNTRVATFSGASTGPGIGSPKPSNVCQVPAFNSFCMMPVFGTPGLTCWCPSGMGPVAGFVAAN